MGKNWTKGKGKNSQRKYGKQKVDMGLFGQTYINYGMKPFGPFGITSQLSIDFLIK
jgi:hypothetical protein